MAIPRERQRFPTRNYPYRAVDDADAPVAAASAEGLRTDTLYRFVLGLDPAPRPMAAEELGDLDDPFGRLLRSGSPFPLTTRGLLAAIDRLAGTPAALPNQLVFVVADGGHVPWTPATAELARSFRFAIARSAGEFSLLISSSTLLDSAEDAAFLQILGWDPTHQVFHFYERRAGTFFWAGTSRHALVEPTRGKGPFDSHVNGAMVMKELRPPWLHWHAPLAGINADALAPDDPLRNDPVFRARVTAERMETEIVRPAIRRWNEVRVGRAIGPDGFWRDVGQFMRQAVTDTTVNLATSDTSSTVLAADTPLRPPLSFFVNRDTLFDTLGLEPESEGATNVVIPGRLYLECLRRYDVHRSDGNLRVDGDSHFAFLTPEPAFEDTHLVDAMMQAGLLSVRLVTCLSMTDFTNPVFSDRRASLLRYAPDKVEGPDVGRALEDRFAEAVRAAVAEGDSVAARPDSPEREFLTNWNAGAGVGEAARRRIGDYFRALQAAAADGDVVDGWFRLMEHRRRRFRRRPLAEFALTTPVTNIPADALGLRMTPRGTVEPIDQPRAGAGSATHIIPH